MVERTLVSEQAITSEGNFQIASLLKYWTEALPQRERRDTTEFDTEFRERFFELHMEAAARKLDMWLESAHGALALLLLLDEYPRRAFRGTPHMYATDPLARLFADYALEHGHDCEVARESRPMFYLPFAHSEDLAHQELSLKLHARSPQQQQAATRHDVIRRFGRFPHRNGILLRITTPEEQAFLNSGGFRG